MATRICIAIKSFEKHPKGLPACTRRIRLPDTRVLYTVLRSPHIDKKSREQFQMITKRQLLIIDAKPNELQRKFFWLKRQRIFGAQFGLVFTSKTRLDKAKLQALLDNKEPDDLGLLCAVMNTVTTNPYDEILLVTCGKPLPVQPWNVGDVVNAGAANIADVGSADAGNDAGAAADADVWWTWAGGGWSRCPVVLINELFRSIRMNALRVLQQTRIM